ncbi:F-box protein CPR1-like [Henckelia pumila]|uniref:F-box protein CPR1-like n=1 Tax=Henckelia pumila TaxID=405737 RepID=UPI003C6E7017
MPILPLDLIEDILSRLPVKSLKRFRSIAKSWCSLVDSEKFIKSHLRRSLNSYSNHHLILGGGPALYSVDLGPLNKARMLKPPFPYNNLDGVMSSCHGLVLVMSEPPVFWNPFARSYRVLPDSSMEPPPGSGFYALVSYGFGYDSITDDYKVLKVMDFKNHVTQVTILMETGIFSLKSNSWKKIQDFPYPLPFVGGHMRAPVNGSMHTLVYADGSTDAARIMAFSFETEKHCEMKLPKGVKTRDSGLSLTVVGGSLCLICMQRSRVVIWVMKEYGVEESCSMLLTIKPPTMGPHFCVKPLVYSRDGNKVLLNWHEKRLVWYDLRKKTLLQVHVDDIPFCVESLVSLEAPGQVKKHGTEKKGKGGSKKR